MRDILPDFTAWAEAQPMVRASILTSTRSIPNTPVDEYSDFDIILILTDIHPFHASRAWLDAFGPLLALYRDPINNEDGIETSGYVIQYEDGLKIDFSLWPVEMLQKVSADGRLPDEMDAGYQVLIDKDGLTTSLMPPTYRAYIPRPPSEAEYLEKIELFFVDTAYVLKYIRRGDEAAAQYILEAMIRQDYIIPMLVWHYESERGWSVKPGLHGRFLRKYLRPDLWEMLASTYTRLEESEQALENVIALMRKAASEVGQRLGYAYPEEMHRRVVGLLKRM